MNAGASKLDELIAKIEREHKEAAKQAVAERDASAFLRAWAARDRKAFEALQETERAVNYLGALVRLRAGASGGSSRDDR